MPHLLIAGGGAVGIPAAVLVARACPDAQISLLDAGTRIKADRTFVLGIGTVNALDALSAWKLLSTAALPLQNARISFAGAFGKLQLSAHDIKSDAYAYSIAESDYLNAWNKMLREQANVELIADAAIESVTTSSDQIAVRCKGRSKAIKGDCIAVAGLPPSLLEPVGFSFSVKRYTQTTAVATIAGSHEECSASERVMQDCVATLVPRRAGWGHIMIGEPASIERLNASSDDDLLSCISRMHNRAFSPDAKIISRGKFQPMMRRAQPAGRGRMVLLGSSACMLHPIGAQELNLGLRDCITLADLLRADPHLHNLSSIGERHAASRSAERAAAAQRTDLAARLSSVRLPGKLAAAGIAAAAVDLVPRMRQALLAAWVVPPSA